VLATPTRYSGTATRKGDEKLSHVALIDLTVDSLDTLAKACEAMGFTFDRQATKWAWYGRWVNDYHADQAAYKQGIPVERYGTSDAGVIRVPGAQYEVGVYQAPGQPGRYRLVYDNFSEGKGLHAKCGPGLGLLKQRYAAERSKKVMRRAGWRVAEKKQDDGQLRLVYTR